MTEGVSVSLDGESFEAMSAIIGSGEPLDVVLSVLMIRTRELLEVQYVALFLAEGPEGQLRLTAASSAIPETQVLLAPGVGVEGWVLQRGRRIAVANPAADPRFATAPRWNTDLPPAERQAIAAVPVRSGSTMVGVLSVVDSVAPNATRASTHPFDSASAAELLPFLGVLADLVGLALENSDILARQERRTELIQLLHTIAAIPASESAEDLAHTITDQLSAITHADIASIFLHSAATDELVAFGSSTTPLGQLQHEHGMDHLPLATSGPLLQVLQQNTPLLLGSGVDIVALPMSSIASIQSLLIVPLCINDVCQGVILLAATSPDAFGDDDLSFLTFISLRLGYALHHDKVANELTAAEQTRIQHDARASFIAVVAHDLKNALTSIGGSSQLALRRVARGNNEYSAKAFNVVVAKAAQALQLVNDMVDVNNVDAGRFRLFIRPVELTALLQEEVEAAQGLSTSHTVTYLSTIPAVEIAADTQRLRQVIDNLITNAIHYSPDGGTITIQLTKAPEQEAAPSESALLPQKVLIAVSDQGMGIAAEDVSRIFDRFYRGRGERVASGSGLGLYIAAEIIAQHGGTIRVESVPGAGATFFITLPVNRNIDTNTAK